MDHKNNFDNNIWSDDEINRLIKLWNEDKTVTEISNSINRTTSAIRNAINRLKKKGLIERHGTNKNPIPWTEDETNLLIDLWNNKNYTVNQIIKEKLLNRSKSSIENYLKDLRKYNKINRRTKIHSKTAWTTEEINKISELYNEGKTTNEISKNVGRSFKAVEQKLSSARISRLSKSNIDNIDWHGLAKNGIVKVNHSEWPNQSFDPNKTSGYIIQQSKLKNINQTTIDIRNLILQADKEKKSKISFIIAENKEDFVNAIATRRKLFKNKYRFKMDKKMQERIGAWMIGDGTCLNMSSNTSRIQLTQVATLQERNKESHLEYLLDTLNKIPLENLTRFALIFTRGIEYKDKEKSNMETSHTWKGRINIFNWDIDKLRNDFYGKVRKGNKTLPSVKKLTEEYLVNDEILADIYQQDGSLHNLYQTPRLHICQNVYPAQCRLALALHKAYNIRSMPVKAEGHTYELYICPIDAEKFFNKVAPYMIPNMYYKLPKSPTIGKTGKLSAKNFDKFYEKAIKFMEMEINYDEECTMYINEFNQKTPLQQID